MQVCEEVPLMRTGVEVQEVSAFVDVDQRDDVWPSIPINRAHFELKQSSWGGKAVWFEEQSRPIVPRTGFQDKTSLCSFTLKAASATQRSC